MNSSALAISSAFWLPEPALEVGWEKPKTKPVQTEVETRLWKICQQTATPKKGVDPGIDLYGFREFKHRERRLRLPEPQ